MSFILLPAAAGAVTGASVFLFKRAAAFVIGRSVEIYGFARENPRFIPLLLAGAALAALAAYLLARFEPSSKGGGIPTAIIILRGLVTFKWLRSIVSVFVASIVTYFVGVPLGNEGPSVLIGTSLGRAVSRVSGKKYRAADRYVMTGGACAGFAASTGAPISGIFFALEETHRRFTPTIVIAAMSGTLAGAWVSSWLTAVSGLPITFFTVPNEASFDLGQVWMAVAAGVFAAAANLAVLWIYSLCRRLHKSVKTAIPAPLRLIIIFTVTAAVGLLLSEALGTGHELIDVILEGKETWYMLLALFAVRSTLAMLSSAEGVTGGLFVPLIAFGTMSGALCAKLLISLGLVGPEYLSALTVVGMAAFLGASLKTPITAVIFTFECFGGLRNTVFIALGVAVAFIISELSEQRSINDIVIGNKLADSHAGSLKQTFDVRMKLQPGAFASGLETRDILWPASCVVLSVSDPSGSDHYGVLRGSDTLLLHYETHDPERTACELKAILGDGETGNVETRLS